MNNEFAVCFPDMLQIGIFGILSFIFHDYFLQETASSEANIMHLKILSIMVYVFDH
jgi:hypothetical protein